MKRNRLSIAVGTGLVGLGLVGCSGMPTLSGNVPPIRTVDHIEVAKVKAAEEAMKKAEAETKEAKTAKAPPSPRGLVESMIERRQAMTATGYAVVSVQNHRLPAQQRLLAIRASKLDAYRALTEQVYGQYLDATTTVADMVVQSDSFRARVEGVIYGATLVSITPVGDDTYETTLSLESAVVDDIRNLYLAQLASAKTR
ncbi:MAG: LPP20 family lipoprotein [Bordetella sp.]